MHRDKKRDGNLRKPNLNRCLASVSGSATTDSYDGSSKAEAYSGGAV
jgi:hypothetical protein